LGAWLRTNELNKAYVEKNKRKAHPFSCKPEKRDPPRKMCRQKKGSQCKYVLDEYANQRLAVASSELKLLQLDPNALNRRSSEVKARPLSPLRNRPMEKQQHAFAG
jgi:hypothetical protein